MKQILIYICGLLLLWPSYANALGSEWASDNNAKARIIVENQSISKMQSQLRGAIEIKLDDGWHTYWRTPGDAGLPPKFDWSDSKNLQNASVGWPVPERFKEAGLHTFGYKNTVTFPVSFDLETPGKALNLKADISLMICKDICIPQTVEIALEIPNGDGAQSEMTSKINNAFRSLPNRGNLDTLKIDNIAVGLDKLVVTASDSRGLGDDTEIYVELEGTSFASPAIMEIDDPDQKPVRQARLIIKAPKDVQNLSSLISGKDVKVTLVNKGRAIERSFSF